MALTGSAPLPPNIIEWYRNLGLELLDVYGMSENFAYSHACKPNEVRVGYVGSVNPGVLHRIADNGEIQVKSPAQMIGYFKMPDKMAEEMTDDGYFKTGDRGEIDEKGHYLSEDWTFCRRWAKLGGEIYAHAKVLLNHSGHYEFAGDLSVLTGGKPTMPDITPAQMAAKAEAQQQQ